MLVDGHVGAVAEGQHRRLLVRVGRALHRAIDEAVLEGADAVEGGAVGGFVRGAGAGLVPYLDHAVDGILQIGVGERERRVLSSGEMGDPRAGEAVGLLLHVDRRVLIGDAALDRVPPLVGEHDADHAGPSCSYSCGRRSASS